MYRPPYFLLYFSGNMYRYQCASQHYPIECATQIDMKGCFWMYNGRDMTELSMMSKGDWKDDELAFFHHSLQQIMPYLNSEGQTVHREIVKEIENRGGLSSLTNPWDEI